MDVTNLDRFDIKVNAAIPGEMTPPELRAIALLATLVPPEGHVVEVGSYLGLSSWHWAQNAPPSATIHCIDPWDGYRRASGIEDFLRNVADCPNVKALQGRSPQDFQHWDIPVDAYFEDAVHRNPVLAQNIEMWMGRLSPGGIVCGHDYADRCPDVVSEVNKLAGAESAGFVRVDSVWAVFPSERLQRDEQAVAVFEQLRQMGHSEPLQLREAPSAILSAEEVRGLNFEVRGLPECIECVAGDRLECKGTITLSAKSAGITLDPEGKPGGMRLGARLFERGSGQRILAARAWVEPASLAVGETSSFSFSLDLKKCPSGRYLLDVGLVCEDHYWLGDRGGQTHQIPVLMREPLLQDRGFWARFTQGGVAHHELGVRKHPGEKVYDLERAEEPMSVRCMLAPDELALLYALARHHYTGSGAIVDTGTLLGLTTNCLARGLRDNKRIAELAKRKKIFVFDRFAEQVITRSSHLIGKTPTGSLFDRFLEVNRDFIDMVYVSPGNLLDMHWDGRPIEILLIDAAKSWDLNDFHVSQFFPALIPGHSVVLQQDYIHYNEPWVHLTMEYFHEHFESIHTVYGGTHAFLCVKEIPTDACAKSLRRLDFSTQVDLFKRAIMKAPAGVAGVVSTAFVKHLVDLGEIERARAVFDSIEPEPEGVPADLVGVKGILKDNREKVRGLLRRT